MDIRILEEAGLTEKEAKLYLVLLEEGSSTTGPLIKKLGLHKATVYSLLERLKERGLVSSVIKDRTQHFQAADPELLVDLQKERQERLAELLPELQKLKARAKKEQSVTVYEGTRATRAAITSFFNALTPDDIHRAFVIANEDPDTLRFFDRLVAQSSKRQVNAQYIFSEDARGEAAHRAKTPRTQIKIVPSSLSSPAVVNFFKDTSFINLLAAKQPIGIEIKSAELAQSFRNQFELLWNQEATVYRGREEVLGLFAHLMEAMKPGEHYSVLGATFGTMQPSLLDWFTAYHKERSLRGINVRLLADPETAIVMREHYRAPPGAQGTTQIHVLPGELKSPLQINIYKDKCAIFGFTKDPFALVIEKKEVVENYRRYFDLLWDQNVHVYRGKEDVLRVFSSLMTECGRGGEYLVLGATSVKTETDLASWFTRYHKARVENGVGIRLLATAKTASLIQKTFPAGPQRSEIRLLPWDIQTPMQINIYKDKCALFSLGDDAIGFVIENKQVTENYRRYFEQLWKQETLVFRGADAVWQFLQEYTKAKEVRLIGARGYYFDRHPEHLAPMRDLLQKHKTVIRNIVDAGAKGNPWLSMPGMQVRYLPKEFESASAISIYDGKVVMTQWAEKEPIVIHINNKNVYDSYVKQFEALWNVAKA